MAQEVRGTSDLRGPEWNVEPRDAKLFYGIAENKKSANEHLTQTRNPKNLTNNLPCSGGAGIQADLKTMMANGVYAMSVITALTAQNTMGVSGIMEVTPEFLKKQLDAVFTDIKPDAVKIGMVASAELIHVIAERLSFYKPKFIVVDPVMVSTSGSRLIEEDAVAALQNELLPMASVITPNIPETEVLTGTKIDSKDRRHRHFITNMRQQFYAKAVTALRMQTITSMGRMVEIGLRVSALIMKIRMEPAVRFPVRLLLIWHRTVN